MVYQPPIADNMASRTQYKSFKGSRHKTKSPMVQNHRSTNQNTFAQSCYQVEGKSGGLGNFSNHGGSPAPIDLINVFASPEPKRTTNPYNLNSGSNSLSKKKSKTSAKKIK